MRMPPTTPDDEAGSPSGCAPACPEAPGQAAPLSHALFRVSRLHHMLAAQLLRTAGLHPGQELVMMRLWADGPQRPSELIRLLDSDAATMTRTVQRLERAGFVRRKPCPSDRRAILIEPTAASQALRAQVEAIWPRLDELCGLGLSEELRTEALAVLAGIERNLAEATRQLKDNRED